VTVIDLVVAGIVLLAAVWGSTRGLLLQIADAFILAATLLVPWKLAGPLAHLLQKPLAESFGMTFLFVALGLVLLVQVIGLLAVAAVRRVLKRRLVGVKVADGKAVAVERPLSTLDRVSGALLGAGRMIVLIWVAYSILAIFDEDLRKVGLRVKAEDSKLYQLANQNNALRLAFGPGIHQLRAAVERLSAAKSRHLNALDAVASDPRFVAAAKDPSVKRWLAEEDLHLLTHSNVLSLITDSTMANALANPAQVQPAAVAGTGE
jgi:hypothetical protein